MISWRCFEYGKLDNGDTQFPQRSKSVGPSTAQQRKVWFVDKLNTELFKMIREAVLRGCFQRQNRIDIKEQSIE